MHHLIEEEHGVYFFRALSENKKERERESSKKSVKLFETFLRKGRLKTFLKHVPESRSDFMIPACPSLALPSSSVACQQCSLLG
jgi:hypothetical protein